MNLYRMTVLHGALGQGNDHRYLVASDDKAADKWAESKTRYGAWKGWPTEVTDEEVQVLLRLGIAVEAEQ